MKQIYFLIIALITGMTSFSQVVPELVFKNPSRSGTNGAIGTVYTFANVATGINAKVEITAKSSNKVTLSEIDLTSSGYANAFQPQVSYDGGEAPKNTTWYMEFTITFVLTSTNLPTPITAFNLTSIDMDGDDDRMREQVTFYGANSYTLENPTSLSVSNTTGGKVFTGSYDDYPNINTSATNIMVTLNYVNTSSLRVRVGATTGNKSTSGAERMSSLWFKSFNYNNPSNATLPVKLTSFRARKDNKTVILDWATSMEKDFSHFIVERGTDGHSFNNIANIDPSATKSYSYNDITASQIPVVYYRLKMVDIDGKYEYSEIKIIRNAKEQDQSAAVVYPNPAINELRITIPSEWQNKSVTYSIYNSNGIIVKQKISSQASQTENFNLSDVKPGMYIIKASSGADAIVKQFNKLNS